MSVGRIQHYLGQKGPEGCLAGLEAVSNQRVAEIARQYPWISPQYLDFISNVGVGESSLLRVYEPAPLEAVSDHPSYQLYGSTSYRKAFSFLNRSPQLPKDVVMVADVGASWRYCLRKGDPSAVFCFDMATADLVREADNFFDFIDRDLLPQS